MTLHPRAELRLIVLWFNGPARTERPLFVELVRVHDVKTRGFFCIRNKWNEINPSTISCITGCVHMDHNWIVYVDITSWFQFAWTALFFFFPVFLFLWWKLISQPVENQRKTGRSSTERKLPGLCSEGAKLCTVSWWAVGFSVWLPLRMKDIYAPEVKNRTFLLNFTSIGFW